MSFRRDFITKPIFSFARGVLPPMSDTEREALEAGDVWWDADLFTGNPDWAKLLAHANKCQGDNDEEESTHHFDRHRVTKEIRHAIRVAEKNNFGRRTIDSVLHELAAGNFDDVRCRHTHDENERRPPEIVAAVASGQTTDRHSQEASQ